MAVLIAFAACGGGQHAPAIPPVHSLKLTTHASPRVLSTCKKAARQARIPVVCPPLVPSDGVVADPNLYGPIVFGSIGASAPGNAGDFYLLTFNNGDNRGHIHWMVGAGRGRMVQKILFDPHVWEIPGRVRRLEDRRYGDWTISFYRFPQFPSGGENGGHDLALTRRGDTTYFVSIHGRTHHDADAAMLIAILRRA